MKNYFSKKSIFALWVLFVFGLFSGCEKNPMDLENITEMDNYSSQTVTAVKSNNFMVITKSEITPADFESKLAAYGKIVKSLPEIGVVVVNANSTDFEKKVSKLAEVQAVVPDIMAKFTEPVKFIPAYNPPSIGDNEPYFSLQWGMDAINAPEAWNAGYRGKNTRVFILDSGIDAEHPDLSPNLNTSLSTSFVPGESYNVEAGFYFNHGTHVAGIIAAADNSFGVIGVAPEAEIVAVKVLSEYTGSGAFSWINAGIVYAANNGADVINMSLGASFSRNGFYLDDQNVLQKMPAVYIQRLIHAQQRAVNYAHKKGVLIVVSAGNDYHNADGDGANYILPAQLQNVVAVSATAPDYWYNDLLNGTPYPNLDIPASYTNYGKSLIDIAAPGGDFDFYNKPFWYYDMVLSTISEGFGWAAGTSMAAPHVSGVAALIIAKNGGEISPNEVTKQLLKTAENISGNGASAFYGNGRVDAYRAVME